MKEKVGVIVCGNSGIDYLKLDFPVEVFRSLLIMDKKEFEDFVDIKAEDFYNVIVNNPDIDLSTSQTATGKMAEVYERYRDEGYTDIIVITIAAKLSGTYQNAILANDLVEGINVHVVDSKSVSHGEVYLVEQAIKMIRAGVPATEIFERLNVLRDNITIYVLVDTLKYLVKNGRLSAVSGLLGGLLKIKPLLKIQSDGSLTSHEKIRTTSKARARLLEIINEEIQGRDVLVFLAYTNNRDDAAKFRDDLLVNNPNLEVLLVPLTPVVGAHAGPGTIGVGIIENK